MAKQSKTTLYQKKRFRATTDYENKRKILKPSEIRTTTKLIAERIRSKRKQTTTKFETKQKKTRAIEIVLALKS